MISHVPSGAWKRKLSLSEVTFILRSLKLDLMSALGSSFICCTALGKLLVSDPPVSLIIESPWVFPPEAYLQKLFLNMVILL